MALAWRADRAIARQHRSTPDLNHVRTVRRKGSAIDVIVIIVLLCDNVVYHYGEQMSFTRYHLSFKNNIQLEWVVGMHTLLTHVLQWGSVQSDWGRRKQPAYISLPPPTPLWTGMGQYVFGQQQEINTHHEYQGTCGLHRMLYDK